MLTHQRILVLGGSAGIGFAVAELAARAGARVTIASSRRDRVEAAVAKLPAGATGEVVDLRDHAAIAALFARVGAAGPIDHLAYTAGEELEFHALGDLDLAAARKRWEIRYWSALAAVQAAAPLMAKTGSIVLTSGTAGSRPHPGFLIGSGICGAMEATTRALAVELAPIRVNIVTPGLVDTELWGNLPADARAQLFASSAVHLPVRHVGTAAEVAEHYLSFMRGTYVTGQRIVVDGGGLLV